MFVFAKPSLATLALCATRYDLMNSVRAAAVLAHATSTPGIDCGQSMAPRSVGQYSRIALIRNCSGGTTRELTEQLIHVVRESPHQAERSAESSRGTVAVPGWQVVTLSPPVEWMPALEIFKRNSKLVVQVDLPGVAADDVTIEIDDDMLTVSGERREGKPP
jgi:hypothetical protein